MLLTDAEMDALLPTQEEKDAYLAEPTPPDDLNQFLDKYLTPEIKQDLARHVVHTRKVAKAQLKQVVEYVFGECENEEHEHGNSGCEYLRYECSDCRQALTGE